MPKIIDRNKLLERLGQRAQLAEVLPRDAYEAVHIREALNIPLTELNRDTVAILDKNKTVIVYCHDYQ